MTTTSNQPTVVTQADWVVGPKQGEWTYDSYATLPDDGQHYEIIDGVLFLMTPTPSPQHQRVSFRIAKRLSVYIEDTNLGEVFIAPLDGVPVMFLHREQERPGHPQGECPSHRRERVGSFVWEGHSPCGCPRSCKKMTPTPHFL